MLTEQELVDRIRYEALIGLLDCAEWEVQDGKDAEVCHHTVLTNITILNAVAKEKERGLCTYLTVPECDCPCECDESDKNNDEVGSLDDVPWIYFTGSFDLGKN